MISAEQRQQFDKTLAEIKELGEFNQAVNSADFKRRIGRVRELFQSHLWGELAHRAQHVQACALASLRAALESATRREAQHRNSPPPKEAVKNADQYETSRTDSRSDSQAGKGKRSGPRG